MAAIEKAYDPYAHMKEICSYPNGGKFMLTCPSELQKLAEERSYQVGGLNDPFVQLQQKRKKAEHEKEPSKVHGNDDSPSEV